MSHSDGNTLPPSQLLPFKRSQTLVLFFSSVYKSPPRSLHQNEQRSDTCGTSADPPGCRTFSRGLLTDRQMDAFSTSDRCEWWRDRGETDGGDNNQLNDRLQVFGFARQRLHWLFCLLVWGRPAATFSHDRGGNRKKSRRWKMFEKEWGNKGFSSGTSLPLLLTFGWTFRRDPPSWPLCKVNAKTGTRRDCKWACRGNVQRGKKVDSGDTRPALLFELFKCSDNKKKEKHVKKRTAALWINICNRQADSN